MNEPEHFLIWEQMPEHLRDDVSMHGVDLGVLEIWPTNKPAGAAIESWIVDSGMDVVLRERFGLGFRMMRPRMFPSVANLPAELEPEL